jgi:hypothetical protein
MKIKSLLFVGILALTSLTMAFAKSYGISLGDTTKAGAVELKAGQYNVKVQGTNAIFTEVEKSKSYTTPVKVEEGTQKFNMTEVETGKVGETLRIKSIKLGGSTTTLVFGD